jgi:hypothetical protein
MKGPPMIKAWESATPEKLAWEMKTCPAGNTGLRLDNYLALDPDDKAAAELLDKMEQEGKLPPTVAWYTWRGMVVRLYNRQNGLLPIKPSSSPKLEIRTSKGQYVLIPFSKVKDGMYRWLEGQSPNEIEVADLPKDSLESIKRTIASTNTSNSKAHAKPASQWAELWRGVGEGGRDDTAAKLAGRLLSHGLTEAEVLEILIVWNNQNNPPLPEKDIARVVNSIDRKEFKKYLEAERSITQEVREWIKLTSSGLFLTSDVHKDLCLTTRDLKKVANEACRRLELDGTLAKCGSKRGCYRILEKDAPEIDFLNVNLQDPVNIKWPFGLEYWVDIYPGNVIVLAGAANAGKTAFMLNVVRQNMFQHRIEYFSSEMGPEEFHLRLSKFDDITLKDWKFHPRRKAGNFADVIVPDAVNIIDYLEINKDFYEIGGEIKAIFDNLNKGIAIIAIQKKAGQETGRGGEFTLEKPRLYLTMDGGKLKILKGKNWAVPESNPNGKEFFFKLVNGCKFIWK